MSSQIQQQVKNSAQDLHKQVGDIQEGEQKINVTEELKKNQAKNETNSDDVPQGDLKKPESEANPAEEDDDEDEDDVIPQNSKFAKLKVIDKPAVPNDEKDSDNDGNREINFSNQVEDLDLNKKTSYHKDEVPSHSIMHNSHDLGHLVKAIDTKPIRHSVKTQEEISGNITGVVKFKGEEIPTQSHTPVHNRQPRNSILKNSPLVQENFHAQIKDIDGKLLGQGHSKFKDTEEDKDEESKREASEVKSEESEEDDDDDEDEETTSVRFKKGKEEIVEPSSAPRHSFSVNSQSSPKKHILKSNLEDSAQLDQLHVKLNTDKSPKHGQHGDPSFGYSSLKNIDGKPVPHDRSPRHKPRFADEDDSGDDKKVHFGGVQNVAKVSEVPSKDLKPRHSILKSQGSGIAVSNNEGLQLIQVQDQIIEGQETNEEKIQQQQTSEHGVKIVEENKK